MNYLIIGNGESRKKIDLELLPAYKVGCNAIYMYDKVDMISAIDKFWREKISKETNIPLLSRKNNTIAQTVLQLYKNGTWTNTNTPYKGYCSGMCALDYIAYQANAQDVIYMIGFEFSYDGDTVNHIYKDTEFHPPSTVKAQKASIFLNEAVSVLKRHPRRRIIYVNDIPCPEMREQITIQQFLDIMWEQI